GHECAAGQIDRGQQVGVLTGRRRHHEGLGQRRLEPVGEFGVAEVEHRRLSERTGSLCVLMMTMSAPWVTGEAGRSGWKPKCAPQAASTISAAPAAWATSARASTSATAPK